MRTLYRFTRVFLIFFYLVAFVNCEKEKDPVVITLTVDVSELGDDRNNPGGCILTAKPDSVVIEDTSTKDFTILVADGTEIIWEGITDDNKKVNINTISYLRGTNIFNTPNLNGQLAGGKQKVKGKIKRPTPPGQDYEYSIRFAVPGHGSYTIDPKIQVN